MDQQHDKRSKSRLDKLGRDAEKIAANARNALDHLRTGDDQLACDIVGLSHYPISHVRVDHDALMDAFTVAGIEPGQVDRAPATGMSNRARCPDCSCRIWAPGPESAGMN